jgi:hypothetical protein
MRHTCAALVIAQGAHPRAIADRLGHSTIRVTMDVYGHLPPGVDEALTAGLEATRVAAQLELAADDSWAGRDHGRGRAYIQGRISPLTSGDT